MGVRRCFHAAPAAWARRDGPAPGPALHRLRGAPLQPRSGVSGDRSGEHVCAGAAGGWAARRLHCSRTASALQTAPGTLAMVICPFEPSYRMYVYTAGSPAHPSRAPPPPQRQQHRSAPFWAWRHMGPPLGMPQGMPPPPGPYHHQGLPPGHGEPYAGPASRDGWSPPGPAPRGCTGCSPPSPPRVHGGHGTAAGHAATAARVRPARRHAAGHAAGDAAASTGDGQPRRPAAAAPIGRGSRSLRVRITRLADELQARDAADRRCWGPGGAALLVRCACSA